MNATKATENSTTAKLVARDVKTLYFGDNGRMTCADLACAGSTAHFSGMAQDLSGAPMELVTLEDVRAFQGAYASAPTCERCGAEASVLVLAGRA